MRLKRSAFRYTLYKNRSRHARAKSIYYIDRAPVFPLPTYGIIYDILIIPCEIVVLTQPKRGLHARNVTASPTSTTTTRLPPRRRQYTLPSVEQRHARPARQSARATTACDLRYRSTVPRVSSTRASVCAQFLCSSSALVRLFCVTMAGRKR